MKEIILLQLHLLNFKGIRDLLISFDGNTNIFGANESGKSTIYTAFTWLLTGKDEFDRADYEIKNTKHKELNRLTHEVEAILLVNGREEKLKRIYIEKWVKQKGQSHKTFEGHKAEYWYNDVPCNLGEYQSKVDAIISPAVIKLVTNPTYFNNLKWSDQRRGLLNIAGEISNDEIVFEIATPDNNYKRLLKIFQEGKSLDELKKQLSAKKLLLKKAAGEFTPRIDEVKRSLPEAQDWSAIELAISNKKARIENIDQILSDASKALEEKQKGIIAKQKSIFSKQTKQTDIRFGVKNELSSRQNDSRQAIAGIEQRVRNINNLIASFKKDQADAENNKGAYMQQLEAKDENLKRLRKQWDEINSERFVFDESKCECPTCKQMLPAEDIESQKTTLLTNFNDSVKRRKAEKVAAADQVKIEIVQLEEHLLALGKINNDQQINEQQALLQPLHARISTLKLTDANKKIEDIEAATDTLLSVNADYLNLKDEIEELQEAITIENAALAGEHDQSEQKLERKALQDDLQLLIKKLGAKELIERTNQRVKELEIDEATNAQAIADIEQQEFEIETFTRAKMDILQKRVNGMFKYVTFRLFEIQVNSAIAETCVCEYKGVPYPTLNTAAKLLAGLDVLNTLSRFYAISAPVFCDNRESVTFIPSTSSQLISLFVSPVDQTLRVEPAARQETVAA